MIIKSNGQHVKSIQDLYIIVGTVLKIYKFTLQENDDPITINYYTSQLNKSQHKHQNHPYKVYAQTGPLK